MFPFLVNTPRSIKTVKVLRPLHSSRARKFPTKLHADVDKLFCTLCNVVLNHDRQSVIVGHFASKKHKLKEDAAQEEGRNKRQKIITGSRKNKTPAEKECVEVTWVKTLTGANIPLSKTDHPLVREFLDSRVRNGGMISARTQLTETCFPEVYLKEKENLKLKLKDRKIAVIFDECCDDEARSVLNVLFAPLQPDFSRMLTLFWWIQCF
uniref:U1-type domain-containing protein n=1 Tax=Chelydra serpentina TaxID=8475 RepID=A0A8C3RRD2_CHESE